MRMVKKLLCSLFGHKLEKRRRDIGYIETYSSRKERGPFNYCIRCFQAVK